jgi:hypothetical protein
LNDKCTSFISVNMSGATDSHTVVIKTGRDVQH